MKLIEGHTFGSIVNLIQPRLLPSFRLRVQQNLLGFSIFDIGFS